MIVACHAVRASRSRDTPEPSERAILLDREYGNAAIGCRGDVEMTQIQISCDDVDAAGRVHGAQHAPRMRDVENCSAAFRTADEQKALCRVQRDPPRALASIGEVLGER